MVDLRRHRPSQVATRVRAKGVWVGRPAMLCTICVAYEWWGGRNGDGVEG